ncbi:hypothetical protein [Nitratifractor sp.]
MKRNLNIATALALGVSLSISLSAGDAQKMVDEAMKVDVAKACDVKSNGLETVVATAAKFNPAAIELGVEFKRLGIRNKEYIRGLQEALKSKSKTVTLHYKKKGKEKTKTFPVDYAAERACKFAVRALQQVREAEKTWRLAVPGDGYKF